jgi:hypothetical protein
MDDDRKDREDDDNNPQPQPTSPPHHATDDNIIIIPSPDIRTPDPLPPSPNIWYEPTHLKSTFLIATIKRREPRYHFGQPIRRRRPPKPKTHNFRTAIRTNPPPDIRPPKPFPPSPNIPSQQSQPHLLSLHNHSPPDICAPKPIPPKPNILIQPSIFQQPCRPSQLRPRRKHPPYTMNQIHSLTPRHHHNVRRRILKKRRLHPFWMFEDEHH